MSIAQFMLKIILICLIFIPRFSIGASDGYNQEIITKIDNAILEINQYRETIKANQENLKEFFNSPEYLSQSNDSSHIIDLTSYIEDALIPLEAFSNRQELILAFSPHQYHTFVVAGDFEFHGVIYPGKGSYRLIRDKAFRSGFFIRFPNLKIANIVRTKQYIKLMDRHKSELCMHAALEVLARGADINLKKKKVHNLSSLVKEILKNGFVDSKGNKIPIQIYRSYHKDMETIFGGIRRIELLYYIPGFLGYIGAKLGRISKNKSTHFLEEQEYYLHPRFPSRHLK
ncbi:MAG: hypothetical protein AB8G05_00580 [Oligoflexales bacterium]